MVYLTELAPIGTLAVSILMILVIPDKRHFPHYAISGGVIMAGYLLTTLGLITYVFSLFGPDPARVKLANGVLVVAVLWIWIVDLRKDPERSLGWTYFVGLVLSITAAGIAWYFSAALGVGLIVTIVGVGLCYVALRILAKKKITQYLEKNLAPIQEKVNASAPKAAKRDENFKRAYNAESEG